MGTAFLASASITVVELSTKAIVGAAFITIIAILAVTYFRNNKRVLRILYFFLMLTLIAVSVILAVLAAQHIGEIAEWSVYGL